MTHQEQIIAVVKEYGKLFGKELGAFRKAMQKQRAGLADEKYARLKKGQNDVFERKLHEVPENLYIMIKGGLTEEAFVYFQSKEGAKWFANTFPVFKVGRGKA